MSKTPKTKKTEKAPKKPKQYQESHFPSMYFNDRGAVICNF